MSWPDGPFWEEAARAQQREGEGQDASVRGGSEARDRQGRQANSDLLLPQMTIQEQEQQQQEQQHRAPAQSPPLPQHSLPPFWRLRSKLGHYHPALAHLHIFIPQTDNAVFASTFH